MKKKSAKQNQLDEDDLRPEYDFEKMTGGVRGKYVDKLKGTVYAAPIDADVAKVFPNAKDENDALRMLVEIAKKAAALSRS